MVTMQPPDDPPPPGAGPTPGAPSASSGPARAEKLLGAAPAIVTPEAVPLDVEVATVGSRGVAYLLDLLIFGAVFLVLSIAQAVLGGAGFVPGWLAIAILLLLAFAWQFGYPIGFETRWRGRTPGKAAMGLRVVTTDGAPIGVRHAAVRATVGLLELTATMGVVAIATSLISPRSQRLGDLAAGTMVVRERRRSEVPASQVFAPPAGFEHYVATLDVSAIDASRYVTLRETLRRAQELPAATAARVTAELAGQLVGMVSPAPPAGCDPTTFLRCVAAAVQSRRPVASTPAPATRAPVTTRPSGFPPPHAEPGAPGAPSPGQDDLSGVPPPHARPRTPGAPPPVTDPRSSSPGPADEPERPGGFQPPS